MRLFSVTNAVGSTLVMLSAEAAFAAPSPPLPPPSSESQKDSSTPEPRDSSGDQNAAEASASAHSPTSPQEPPQASAAGAPRSLSAKTEDGVVQLMPRNDLPLVEEERGRITTGLMLGPDGANLLQQLMAILAGTSTKSIAYFGLGTGIAVGTMQGTGAALGKSAATGGGLLTDLAIGFRLFPSRPLGGRIEFGPALGGGLGVRDGSSQDVAVLNLGGHARAEVVWRIPHSIFMLGAGYRLGAGAVFVLSEDTVGSFTHTILFSMGWRESHAKY